MDFDKSGDGALQLDEFVGVDMFKNKLDDLSRMEKALAKEKQRAAELEQEAAKLIQAQMDFINDREPSTSDKFISILPCKWDIYVICLKIFCLHFTFAKHDITLLIGFVLKIYFPCWMAFSLESI